MGGVRIDGEEHKDCYAGEPHFQRKVHNPGEGKYWWQSLEGDKAHLRPLGLVGRVNIQCSLDRTGLRQVQVQAQRDMMGMEFD